MSEGEEERRGVRLTNVDGSLLLVSSEHPHFDVGTPQGGDALRNTLQEGREGEVVVCRKGGKGRWWCAGSTVAIYPTTYWS